jgi:hypothetical protein
MKKIGNGTTLSCARCERSVSRPLVVTNIKTRERLRLHRGCFVKIVNAVSANTRRGILHAVKRQGQ